MPVTVQMKNRDITFVTKDGVSKGVVNILGKVTTLTHKTVQTFEDTVEVEQPAELLEKALDRKSVYWKALPLVNPALATRIRKKKKKKKKKKKNRPPDRGQGRERPGPHRALLGWISRCRPSTMSKRRHRR